MLQERAREEQPEHLKERAAGSDPSDALCYIQVLAADNWPLIKDDFIPIAIGPKHPTPTPAEYQSAFLSSPHPL